MLANNVPPEAVASVTKAHTVFITVGVAWRGSSMRLDHNFHVTSIAGDPKKCPHAGLVWQREGRHEEGTIETWTLPRALICLQEGVIVGAICGDCISEHLALL